MTRPRRYLIRMAIFLGAVAGIAVLLLPGLSGAFYANPPLNGLILGVLLVGIGYNIRQVLTLEPGITWIELYRRNAAVLASRRPPRLLAPMAAMLGERRGRFALSAMSMRSILDGIGSRLDESRDISRYLIGLMIFLGLLGTFWGLLETVGAVSTVIQGLGTSTDTTAMFNDLQRGLKAPLSGMGTAFGTSLFGLAGALVLGFLDLQAGQAQNRFYNDLEDWLSGITRVASSGPMVEGDQAVPAYIQALLEQTADNLENLERTMSRVEDARGQNNATLVALAERLTQLTDQMRTDHQLISRLAESQIELKPLIQRMVQSMDKGSMGIDEPTRAHIRNLDVLMARLVQESSAGRAQMVQDLRNEIRLLARTIAAQAEELR